MSIAEAEMVEMVGVVVMEVRVAWEAAVEKERMDTIVRSKVEMEVQEELEDLVVMVVMVARGAEEETEGIVDLVVCVSYKLPPLNCSCLLKLTAWLVSLASEVMAVMEVKVV